MIIFFFGEDNFRSRRKLSEIRQKYLNSDKSGSGLSVFDCEEEKEVSKKIANVFGTPNLLAPKRLLIVKNLIMLGPDDEQKKVLEFLKKNKEKHGHDQDTVAVFWEKGAPKKNGVLYKFLFANSKSQNFEKLTGVKLRAWVLRALGEIDPVATISEKALQKILLFCGDDSNLIFSELEKLAAHADGEMIEEKDVDLLVRAKADAGVFQMVDAIGSNDKKQALRLFHSLLEKGDDPFYLLSMFFYQFRNMLRVADLAEKGMENDYEISRATGLHPFVVKKSLSQINRFSFSGFKKIYQKLGELDTNVKTGKVEIKLALDKFLVEI
jgi:DNA polymerase III subunit delta